MYIIKCIIYYHGQYIAFTFNDRIELDAIA